MLKLAKYIFKTAMDNNIHKKQVNLMRFLSQVTRELGVSKYTYVVGGAVRNFIIDQPIKDLDLVIDSIRAGKDSDWLAKEIAKKLPCESSIATNNYGVAILTVKGPWILDGEDMSGEVLEIANARKESYGGVGGKGYKPDTVEPATIEDDVYRREFTFNTLLWDFDSLSDGPKEEHKKNQSMGGKVWDLTGRGLEDLSKRELRTPGEPIKTFKDDPTRLLRAIKFTAKYNFIIPEDLEENIKSCADTLKDPKIPHEAIGKILINDVLHRDDPVKYFNLLQKLKLWNPINERLQEEPPFASFLAGALENIDIRVTLAMIESGLITKNPLSALKPHEIELFKKNIQGMSEEETREYLKAVKKPALDNEKLMSLGLQGRALGVAGALAKEIILMKPQLFKETSTLTDMVTHKMGLTAA